MKLLEDKLYQKINGLRKSPVANEINNKLQYFKSFSKRNNSEWFSELCFCILTANSKAETALKIQKFLGEKGFLEKTEKELATIIRQFNHRFHNNKAKYIVLARQFLNIKELIKNLDDFEARDFIVKNIKGLGWKEASHFLRNVGFFNLAILDRHILNVMVENNLISIKPQILDEKTYLELEKKLLIVCEKLKMSQAELDFYLWYLRTGKVLK